MEETSVQAPILVGELNLHPESQEIYDFVIGKLPTIEAEPLHLLVHGPAGSGKTILLQAIAQGTRNYFQSDDSCILTAPTAIGAELLNANTINSTFIMWENETEIEKFLEVAEEKHLKQLQWMKKSKVLLIDIINFVGSITFAAISHRLSQLTGNYAPFGGLSVVVFGDFLQLHTIREPNVFEGLPANFESKQSEKCPNAPNNLWTLFKVEFLRGNKRNVIEEQQQLLDSVRGAIDAENMRNFLIKHCLEHLDIHQTPETILNALEALKATNVGKKFAILGWTKEIVNTINTLAVERFNSPKRFPPLFSEQSIFEKRGNLADKLLIVAVGCLVQLTHNETDRHVNNGSFGTVESFTEDEVTVRFSTGNVAVTRQNWFYEFQNGNIERWEQFPLRLAYAFQVHRCQGTTFDGIILVRNRKWAEMANWCPGRHDPPGGLYSALSRARDLRLCRLIPLRWLDFNFSQKGKEEIKRMRPNQRE